MNKKAILLLFSSCLALSGLTCNHILWYRSVSQSLLSHCRKLNVQNISALNIASEIMLKKTVTNKYFRMPSYCIEELSAEGQQSLHDLDIFAIKNETLIKDIVGEKLRVYADEYDKQLTDSAKLDNTVVSLMLALNALALLFLGLFLSEDAKLVSIQDSDRQGNSE